ncbi:hypothetical protein GWK48_11145 [Metallosphaera tengchongensis]|uniref:Uncharacterized protein n=1 Tax=Metallosphaera tengchongensis TaxID=1532350 RepID=A0A6N0NXC6_9CREN|nr:hypothetical protein [Metallosphaera tengchongensis]QKR00865.1 hypothetical protein GWK48_11145 [Metallosphaera tengchongensis]
MEKVFIFLFGRYNTWKTMSGPSLPNLGVKDELDTLYYYAIYLSPGLFESLIDEMAERRELSKVKLLREMGMSTGTPYKSLGREAREKILREAVKILGPEYVISEMFFDIKFIYEGFVNDVLQALNALGTENVEGLRNTVLNEADNIRILVRDESGIKHKVYTVRQLSTKDVKSADE